MQEGIPPAILSNLRNVLQSCDEFKSDASLSSIFVDARVNTWKGSIPKADTKRERVNAIIEFLYDKHDSKGENALILLLNVLKDARPDNDSLKIELNQLIEALAKPASITENGQYPTPQFEDNLPRLQKYLPNNIYQDIKRAMPDNERLTLCVKPLQQLLQAVVTYLPRHLALELLHKPALGTENRGHFLNGTLLFADISSFTALSETLMKRGGKEGTEEIVRLVNDYLDVMLDILFKHNGLLVKFSGDAMLCMFIDEKHNALDAVLTAWEMKQAVVNRFSDIETLGEMLTLNMKVGSNSGQLFAANVGTIEHMEFMVTGAAVEHTAQAESVAREGDVLISSDTYALVKDCVDVEPVVQQDDFYRVINVHFDSQSLSKSPQYRVEVALAKLTDDVSGLVARLDRLTPYLPTGVLPKLIYNPQQGEIMGQHRQVTVLFVNFSGVSAIIKATGEKDEAAITKVLSEYFITMQEEIHYYGGVINKVDLYNQGDKLMVIFGAPIAHEQDARRAALTALAMQDAMLNKLTAPYTELLSQRIGIHTGYVFAGNVGSSVCQRREYTVMGDTVNLAARLMSEAGDKEIWISHQVWERIHAGFKAEGPTHIKFDGIDEEIPVWRLKSAREWVDRSWQRDFDSITVGRETELEKLGEHLEAILSGVGKQMVAIIGEIGVGKTRLVEEWRERTGVSKVIWLTGRAYAYGQTTYGLFIEILHQLLGFTDQDTDGARWRKLSNQLKHILQEGSESSQGDEYLNHQAYLGQFLSLDFSKREELETRVEKLSGENLRLQTHWAICDLLTHTAREKPLVLILEDLHWADVASLDLLEFVSEQVANDVPLLFCLIYRPQKERPVWTTWNNIKRTYPDVDCSAIEIKELERSDGAKLLFDLLKCQLPERLQTLILDATDGNPLYLEEIVHDLLERDIIRQTDGECLVMWETGGIDVPDTLAQVIQSRIDELEFSNPGALQVLWLASVIGDESTQELLSHLYTTVMDRSREMFARHLRDLEVAELLEKGKPRGQWRYRFRHNLVRQVTYENILVEKRREYHRAVGSWIEDTYKGNLSGHYASLAHHFDQAQQWESAFEYHWRAGIQDANAYANKDAERHLRRALELTKHIVLKPDILAQVHFELGKTFAVMGEYDDALKHLKQAYALFENSQENASTRARVCYRIGRIYERKGGHKNLAIALEWLGKGLLLLPETPTPEAALLQALGGFISFRKAEYAEAIHQLERSLTLAQEVDARSEIRLAHSMLGESWRAQGDFKQALLYCQRSIELDEKSSNMIGLAKDYSNQGVYAFEMDDWSLTQESYRKAIEVLKHVGDKYQLAITSCNLADLQCHLGDLEQGTINAQRGLRLFIELESYQGITFAHTVWATLYWRMGNLEQAREQILEARKLDEKHNIDWSRPTIGRWLAQVYFSEGNVAQAENEIQALLSLDEGVLADEVEPIQHLWGLILAEQGKFDEAVQVLESSLERLEQNQAQYQAGRALLALAHVLTCMGQVAKAKIHAQRANAIFVKLGAKLDADEAQEFMGENNEIG